MHNIHANTINYDMTSLELFAPQELTRIHNELVTEEQEEAKLDRISRIIAWLHEGEEEIECYKELAKTPIKEKIKVIGKCFQCSNEFKTPKNRKSIFCSTICRSRQRRDLKIDHESRVCKECFSWFETYKYRKKEFCSRACISKVYYRTKLVELKHKVLNCQNCKSDFKKHLGAKRKFCSISCSNKFRRGSKSSTQGNTCQ